MVENSASHQELTVKVFDKVLKEDYLKNTNGSSGKKKKKKKTPRGKLVGSLDQGTSSTRFVIFTEKGRIAAYAQAEHTQHYPNAGWHEHDPIEIWQKTVACIQAVQHALNGTQNIQLSAMGITNQRETTVAWNKVTGVPYHYAIVWDDARTAEIASSVAQGNTDKLRAQTGLPLASYFSGTKVKWLIDNVPQLQEDLHKIPEQVCFGTIDSWLLYQLTGTPSDVAGAANCGGIHVTDVTNASRWLFMNLQTCKWDQSLIDQVCLPHKVPTSVLPPICPSQHLYATCSSTSSNLPLLIDKVPLTAILGDQQAALFGQTAFQRGQAKNTYGTGLFLMMNTGNERVASTHGLLTTVAYQLENEEVVYALEGSVSHSGSTIQWLRDQLDMIPDATSSEKFAKQVDSNEGCYLVPAFGGLFCPHWRDDARACIVGLTAAHGKAHVCRAALEATAYQTLEVFHAMQADCQNTQGTAGDALTLESLRVDGGGTHNGLLMQFQSDMLDVDVIQPTVMETTALGAAFCAGLQIKVWKDMDELTMLWSVANTYTPKMERSLVEANLAGWRKAVSKSLNWVNTSNNSDESSQESAVLVSQPSSPQEPKPMVKTAGDGPAFKTVDGRSLAGTTTATEMNSAKVSGEGDANRSRAKEVPDHPMPSTSTSRSVTSSPSASLKVVPLLVATAAGAAVGFALGKNRR